MKEAIANVGVFNLIIIFTIILLSFFIGSLSYSKAYKVKNRIINEIELDGGFNDDTAIMIDNYITDVGYRAESDVNCSDINGAKSIDTKSRYQYCLYKYEFKVVSGDKISYVSGDEASYVPEDKISKIVVYYKAITYMYFDVPIIDGLIKIPISGETKPFVTIKS